MKNDPARLVYSEGAFLLVVYGRTVRRSSLPSLLLALQLAGSSLGAAAAERKATRLIYERGAGAEHCPDELDVKNAVAARLGYDPFDERAPGSVSARLAREGDKLVGRVEVRDADGRTVGSREITSGQNDCTELASALTLAVSIAVDPLSIARPDAPPAPPAPVPAPDCPRATAPHVAPCPAPPPEADAPVSFRASAGLLAAFAASPSPVALGVAADVGIQWRALSVDVGGRADVPASRGTALGRVSTSLILATLAPCGHVSVFAGCALVAAGVLRGENVDAGVRDTTPYAALGARAAAEIPLYDVIGVRLHADLLATLTRTVLSVNGGEAWRTPPLSGATGAALVGDFQ